MFLYHNKLEVEVFTFESDRRDELQQGVSNHVTEGQKMMEIKILEKCFRN